MATVQHVLDQAASDTTLTEADVAAALDDVLRHMRGSAPMTSADADYLLTYGGLSESTKKRLREERPEDMRKRREQVAASGQMYALAVSYSIAEAAAALDLHHTTVRRRFEHLAGFTLGRRGRIPRWVIQNGQQLPKLDGIDPKIWREIHPLVLSEIMTNPHDALGNQSPVQWLLGGGEAKAVESLLEAEVRW